MDEMYEREVVIFDGALELPSDQRASYLDGACGSDAILRQRIEALLNAAERPSDVLDGTAPAAAIAGSSERPLCTSFEKIGDIIGRYKLLQQIGEGGCGIVYMAEQQEPVRRRVALKVIKLGMDTKSVIARFEAERQALALMDHPNIARVLDAGATETGRPYFVMELVRGVKITDFCDQNSLSTRDRLDLFTQVCRAIQHAHQKGIIHRDIKPSNVLVTLHDGLPVPKVIDFGIAKATQGRLTDHTLFTAFEQFIGTPAYTSPEQAEMSGIDIDTRTDIYSLGVLLYELLTGKTPFETKELLAVGLDQMRRTIREREPDRPSTRLSTMLAGDLTTTASCRQTEPPKLIRLIRGDLDWVVMKCLEKDRTRRYDTANGLASDIERHLNNEPVLARPPSNAYRFQKMVRRNKLAFAAGSSVAAALLIGLGFSIVLYVKERAANRRVLASERTAQLEASRARRAEEKTREQLWHSYLNQAQANRWSGRVGRRFDSLEILKRAAQMWPAPELRNEAIACMALPDLQPVQMFSGPLQNLTCFSLDPSTDRYAAGDIEGNVVIGSVQEQREIRRLPPFAPPITEVLWSPDGQFLSIKFRQEGQCQLWNVSKEHVLLDVYPHSCRTVAFSPDGAVFAAAQNGGSDPVMAENGGLPLKGHPIHVFDLRTREKIAFMDHPSLPWSMAFSPLGDRLATSSDLTNALTIYDARSGHVLQTLEHPHPVLGVDWDPNGRLLAAGCGHDVYLWKTATSNLFTILRGHGGPVVEVRFSPSTLLGTYGYDSTFRLWAPLTGKEVLQMPVLKNWSFAPSDRWSHWDNNKVSVGLLDSARECRQLRSNSDPNSRIFSINLDVSGRFLLAAPLDKISVWDLERGAEIGSVPEPRCYAAFFTPDKKSIITAHELEGLKRWPIAFDPGPPGELHCTGPGVAFGPRQDPWCPRASADGRTMAFRFGRSIHLWDADTTTEKMVIPDKAYYSWLALNNDGTLCAACTASKTNLSIWQCTTGKLLKSLTVPEVAKLYFSPDSAWLVTSAPKEYRFWNTKTWECAKVIPRQSAFASKQYVAFSPDGRSMAVTGSPDSVWLIDLATGQRLAVFEAPEQTGINDLTFTPNGHELIVANTTGAIHVWNLPLIRSQLASMNLDWEDVPIKAK